MDKGKILVLILLIIGAVLVCGCPYDLAKPMVECQYNSDTGTWDCYMWTYVETSTPVGLKQELKQLKWTARYCNPFDTETMTQVCYGGPYIPVSPSPSPSPSPTNNGPTYKISETGQGGGGGGGCGSLIC